MSKSDRGRETRTSGEHPRFDEQQVVDQDKSRAELVTADGSAMPIKVGDQMLITAGQGPRPSRSERSASPACCR